MWYKDLRELEQGEYIQSYSEGLFPLRSGFPCFACDRKLSLSPGKERGPREKSRGQALHLRIHLFRIPPGRNLPVSRLALPSNCQPELPTLRSPRLAPVGERQVESMSTTLLGET